MPRRCRRGSFRSVGKIIGIDLGTTNSLVAVVESGIPLVLADGRGQRLTPSVVHVPASGEPVVGWEARRGRVAHPAPPVTSSPRVRGRRGGARLRRPAARPGERVLELGPAPAELVRDVHAEHQPLTQPQRARQSRGEGQPPPLVAAPAPLKRDLSAGAATAISGQSIIGAKCNNYGRFKY